MNNSAAQDSLSKFSYFPPSQLPFENVFLFSKLKYLSSLHTIELSFQTNLLDTLYKNLPGLKNLTHFKMSIPFTNSKCMGELLHSLQRLNKLTSLLLNFQSKCHLGPGELNDLPRFLKCLKQIRSLELIFSKLKGLSDEDLVSITSVFPKRPLLSQVSLHFSTGKTIKGSTLVRIFHNLRNVSDITLILHDCSVIQEKGFCALAKGLKLLNFSLVQNLGIHLPHNLDSESFLRVSDALKKFTSLYSLHLNFLGCFPLSNQGMEFICSALESLSSLHYLSLTIPFSNTGDLIIGNIASVLKSLQNLIQLKLNFPHDMKTSHDQICQLFTNIGILTSLQSLEISLMNPKELSDDCLQVLSQSLRKLLLLKELALSFNSASFITVIGVGAIADSLKELQKLTFLGLAIQYSQKLNEEAIEKITEALCWLPLLYSTSFAFRGCPGLKKERSLARLWNALREMKCIQKVSLNGFTIEVNERKIVRKIELW